MINNRQNGRRRGRGGPQMRGGAGNGSGNRIDNRARGNAAQLHEKYRNLARDAQTQGDRVMTEYYLQFADHYFRVLSETRARFEENQPRRQMHDDLDYGDEGEAFDDRGGQLRQDQRLERGEQRFDRDEPRLDRAREGREQAAQNREPEAQEQTGGALYPSEEEAPQRSRRGRRPRRDGAGDEQAVAATAERIEIDRLPPAFVPAGDRADGEPEDEAERPKRRRARRANKEDGDSVAA